MLKNLLPIGSIVTLKGNDKKVMITGIKQILSDDPKTIYDYIAVLYPEGFLGAEANVLFNGPDITEVVHKGYDSPEREQFIELISAEFEKLAGSNGD